MNLLGVFFILFKYLYECLTKSWKGHTLYSNEYLNEVNMMSTSDNCEIFCFDEVKVNRVKGMIDQQSIQGMVRIFKALADETRMKIAYALCAEDELCVCDIANIINGSTATASHHLRLLKNMGLAKYRKEGKLVFYSLDDDHVKQLILMAHVHADEQKGQ